MRKVYIVLHTLSIGGAERHASTIANYLSRNDYNVTIILLDNNTVEFYLEKNIDVVSISHMSFPSYIANSKTSISESLLLKLSKLFSKKDFLYYDKFLYTD